ncbi:MAG: ketol-acid reductoisomerase [Deltaproteobacteria bacterium]|nr:MAG: ketol-acid reductoisomerase [Deltaproteobacteria bacterium]
MTVIYRDADADVGAVEGQTLAILGYGNQGRAQAQNLRDSGLEVIVGNIEDECLEHARADGFEVLSIAEASARADILFLLTADEIMPEVYARDVAPHLAPGKLLDFAHGYNIAFDRIVPPDSVDVIFIAPRMIGAGVRDSYVSGEGFPSFVGVHHDATGTARARMLGLARALGSTRAGCLEMTMNDEATLDLFTEQAFGPAFGHVMLTAIQTLVDAGYPPEAVLLELYLSGELAYSFSKIRELGMLEQNRLHSHTSQYGTITRTGRYTELDPILSQKMRETLEEIRSGAFAREWSSDREAKLALVENVRELQRKLPLTAWEDRTRRAFGIGDAREEPAG